MLTAEFPYYYLLFIYIRIKSKYKNCIEAANNYMKIMRLYITLQVEAYRVLSIVSYSIILSGCLMSLISDIWYGMIY